MQIYLHLTTLRDNGRLRPLYHINGEERDDKIFKTLSIVIIAVCLLTACGGYNQLFGGKNAGVMTYVEYEAAPIDSEVTVETYVQAANPWYDGKITLYTQDKDGGYFIYEMPCTEDEAKELVPGTKIKVHFKLNRLSIMGRRGCYENQKIQHPYSRKCLINLSLNSAPQLKPSQR